MIRPGRRCDSHVHIVAPDGAGMLADRLYTPGAATPEMLEAVAGPLGVGRFVVVQPSFYGTDNSVTLGALRALGGRGRGVAVIDPARTDAVALASMHEAGVRGLRINLYSTLAGKLPGSGAAALERAFGATAAVAARMGWHVEVLAAMAMLVRCADLLARSPAPVVLDHYGLYADTPESRDGEVLQGLVGRGHVWVKLSAPYRVEADPLALRPDPAWLEAFLRMAPRRCVWGSDWPHTPPHELQTGMQMGDAAPLPYRTLDYADVLHGFRDAVGRAEVADRVMIDNPAGLYGFEE